MPKRSYIKRKKKSNKRKRSFIKHSIKKKSRKDKQLYSKNRSYRKYKNIDKTIILNPPRKVENEFFNIVSDYVKQPIETSYVKDSMYYKYLNTKHTLEIKRLGALGKIINNVNVIEGPVDMVGLVPSKKLIAIYERLGINYSAPQILLFGDVHTGNQGCIESVNMECKNEDKCYSFYTSPNNKSFVKFLDELGEKYKIGLFLEMWISSLYRHKISLDFIKSRHNSGLTNTTTRLATCFSQRSSKWSERRTSKNINCEVNNIEVHMSDPRHTFDDPQDIMYQADLIIVMFIKLLRHTTPGTVKSKFKRFVSIYFPAMKEEDVLNVIYNILMKNNGYYVSFWNTLFFETYSRTRRQINKLPNELIDVMKKFPFQYAKSIDQSLFSHFSLLNIILNMLAGKEPEKVLVGYINSMKENEYEEMVNGFRVHDMLDVYYIARTLRPEFRLELSVGYFGRNHINNIVKFFTENGLYEVVFEYGMKGDIEGIQNKQNELIKRGEFDESRKIKDFFEGGVNKCIPLT